MVTGPGAYSVDARRWKPSLTFAGQSPICAPPAGGARTWVTFAVLHWPCRLCRDVLRRSSRRPPADDPDLIFRKSTVFHWVSPNDKLATYGLDDPVVEGVACHFTVPEKGGFKGWIGVAEEVSDISLACRQVGPIKFNAKFEQGEDVFRRRRSLFFKKMQIVRGCDVKRNVLVYMVYSDRIIEGSPKNSTSTVPIMPWGMSDGAEVRRLGRELSEPGRRSRRPACCGSARAGDRDEVLAASAGAGVLRSLPAPRR